MATGYEPNIEGALQVLVDLMEGNGFTMTRSPYAPNYRGLVDALIDLKEGFPTFVPFRVGFDAELFEDVSQGDALYLRSSDGKAGKAIASGTLDQAYVVGIADTTKATGEIVKVLVTGVEAIAGLDAGDHYFLSAASAEVGGKFEQLVTGLSQAIGSIVQFGFLLQGTKLGEKITDSFKGLLNKIPGVGRVAGAAQAGSGLLGRVGGGIAKFAGAAAGPLGLAVGAGFLVKGLADAFKTFNRKSTKFYFNGFFFI